MTTVNFYDSTATRIVETRTYSRRSLALAACKRAARRGVIATIAHVRTAADQPTTHH